MTVTADRTDLRPVPVPPSAPVAPTTPVWWERITGALVPAVAVWYLPGLLIAPTAPWLAWPFAAALLLLTAYVTVSWLGRLRRVPVPLTEVARGAEPLVAVVVPTAGEPLAMLDATLRSVLAQDWPHDRLCLAIGDDAGRDEVRELVARLRAEFPAAAILGYRPPPRGSALRRGEAKAGNLNAALRMLDARRIAAEFIETRDADDLVGDPRFLRRTVAQLVRDDRVGYVQTVKDAVVAPGDPFGNLDPMFQRAGLTARTAVNAVFPLGSGLVWRRRALDSIGRFPSWNLVEDLHSGVEAMRRGWRGVHLPITGVVGQSAPEDIPNVYKQRGTWAIDAFRLIVWGRLRGLSGWQRLALAELGLFHLVGAATLVAASVVTIGLLTGHPVGGGWPFPVAFELYLLARNGHSGVRALLRTRQLWTGLAPVHAAALIRAVRYGPRRKPGYRVTRKSHEFGWYWRETLPQTVITVFLAAGAIAALAAGDPGALYWTGTPAVLLGTFLARSRHGLRSIQWRGDRR